MEPLTLTLESAHGCEITANCYEPDSPTIAGLVIAPAMAVQQSFYDAFARFIARQGYRVWTFDYHGVGASRQGSMRACKSDVSSWVKTDFELVVKHATIELAGLPLYVLGHSLGGLITPFLPSAKQLSGVINIAVGSGAKRHMQPRLQRSTPWLWHVVSPLLCKLFGYFPGARIGIVGDIPRNAMFQWRGWCLNSDYLLDAEPGAKEAYSELSCPMLSLFFSDDELLRESGARWLHNAYTGAHVDYQFLDAAKIDTPRIGHFGFFKPRQEKPLWPKVSHWLEQQSTAARAHQSGNGFF